MDCCANHNRLDKIRHTFEFHSIHCGAISPRTAPEAGNGRPAGEPDYCCFKCPVLKGTESAIPCCDEHTKAAEAENAPA